MDTTKRVEYFRVRMISREELLRFLAEGKHLPGRRPSRRSRVDAQARVSVNR